MLKELSALLFGKTIHALVVVTTGDNEYSVTACGQHILAGTIDPDYLSKVNCTQCLDNLTNSPK